MLLITFIPAETKPMLGAVLLKNSNKMNEQILERLRNEFAFVGDEKISGHTAMKIINNVVEEFLHFIGNRTLVGYYLEFDVAMINKYIKPKLGITLPNKMLEVSAIYHDFKIERIPQANIDLRFNTIMDELDIPSLGKHDAYNDAIMTSMIFIKLKNSPKVKLN